MAEHRAAQQQQGGQCTATLASASATTCLSVSCVDAWIHYNFQRSHATRRIIERSSPAFSKCHAPVLSVPGGGLDRQGDETQTNSTFVVGRGRRRRRTTLFLAGPNKWEREVVVVRVHGHRRPSCQVARQSQRDREASFCSGSTGGRAPSSKKQHQPPNNPRSRHAQGPLPFWSSFCSGSAGGLAPPAPPREKVHTGPEIAFTRPPTQALLLRTRGRECLLKMPSFASHRRSSRDRKPTAKIAPASGTLNARDCLKRRSRAIKKASNAARSVEWVALHAYHACLSCMPTPFMHAYAFHACLCLSCTQDRLLFQAQEPGAEGNPLRPP